MRFSLVIQYSESLFQSSELLLKMGENESPQLIWKKNK